MEYALEEGGLLLIVAGSVKLDLDFQDRGDIGAKPKDDDVAVNHRGDDGLGVCFGDLVGCFTNVEL